MATNNTQILANFLEQALAAAPEKERNQLAQALEDYFEQFPNTRIQSPMLEKFLGAMQEATDARFTFKR